MPRYVALLRGVSPMNCRMPALKAALEAAGLDKVKTVLASGNAAFDARRAAEATLARRCEKAMEEHMGRSFPTLVRSTEHLQALLEADPFSAFELPAGAKRVVTFLPEPPARPPRLPIEVQHARILALRGAELLTAYVPQPGNPVFMSLIEKTFGKELTTRSWDTVRKCAAA